MTQDPKTNTIEIAEGILLKMSNGRWHYYFRYEGQQYRKSTKTRNTAKAMQIALNDYHEVCKRQYLGISLKKISFKQLIDRYLQMLEGSSPSKIKYHKETIYRHFLEYFGKYDDLARIDAQSVDNYLLYRHRKSAITNKTLNRENTVFNQMMNLAHEYGWINKAIKIKHQKEHLNRRLAFTDDEYQILVKTAQQRMDAFSHSHLDGQSKGLYTTKFWCRALLHDIIIILAHTGLRVDEIGSIIWRDIDFSDQSIKLNGYGKMRSNRTIYMKGQNAVIALKRIHKRRVDYIALHGGNFNNTEKIQSLPNGKACHSMNSSFKALVNACGFASSSLPNTHTLTSLRHTYATQRLKEKQITTRSLALQMGTSERMIQLYYGHDTVHDYKAVLVG